MSRAAIEPILEGIPAARQKDARHYGVHPYFTRRPANVVRAYIERYSCAGDTVCDPFGGTGVTAIEAMLLGRRAIHNDLNPFANFIARSIADTTLTSMAPLHDAFERLERKCKETVGSIEADDNVAQSWLGRLPLPENILLPRSSDAERFHDLFSPRQLAGLALIKQAIDAQPKSVIRDCLLLAWSASIAKLNKTFLSAKGRLASRGGSSIFSIYRYKVAAEPVELPIWSTFRGRFQNVVAAKEEILKCCRYRQKQAASDDALDSRRDFRVLAEDAARLDEVIEPSSVDYIFTDPPYGAFISYLDLSILWNHWLGFSVSDEDLEQETIVGGERGHSEEHYKDSLGRSIDVCLRLLKPDRWFSIVFQHWDLSYFATILETASDAGAELKAAITHTGDVIWSMHKKKNSASVIAGEMIITFYKPHRPRKPKERPPRIAVADPRTILSEVFDYCLANGHETFMSEALLNQLVIELWNRRALSCLSLERREFANRLQERGWHYDTSSHLWHRGDFPKPSSAKLPMLFETH